MAQSSMTVRMDSNIKQQFDSLCQQFGMSANTAINIFINQVVRKKGIPFEITAKPDREEIRQRVLNAVADAHANAVANQEDELTLDEINEEICVSRRNRKG